MEDGTNGAHRLPNWVRGDWVPPTRLTDAQARDLPEAIAAVDRSLVPATPDEAKAILAPFMVSCILDDLPESAWAVHLRNLAEDTADVPPDILAECCRMWRRTEKFFPKIAEFLELARPLLAKRRLAKRRLEALARVAECPAPEIGVVDDVWLTRILATKREKPRDGGPVSLGDIAIGYAEERPRQGERR